MTRRIRKLVIWAAFTLPAIVPFSCSSPLLKELTPFVIDGSNSFMHDVIFSAAPLLL